MGMMCIIIMIMRREGRDEMVRRFDDTMADRVALELAHGRNQAKQSVIDESLERRGRRTGTGNLPDQLHHQEGGMFGERRDEPIRRCQVRNQSRVVLHIQRRDHQA